MSKQAVEKWHIAGFQAVHSACQQGSKAAQMMQQKSTDADLKQFASQVKETMDRHGNTLADYLKNAGAPIDRAHDEIMDGISRGTKLMLEAAVDPAATDIALLSGGTVAANYFVTAFKKSGTLAQLLGIEEQVARFSQMTDEQQQLIDRYNAIANSTIYPQALAS